MQAEKEIGRKASPPQTAQTIQGSDSNKKTPANFGLYFLCDDQGIPKRSEDSSPQTVGAHLDHLKLLIP